MSVKFNKDAPTMEDYYLPLSHITTQAEADEFLKDYKENYLANYPQIANDPKFADFVITMTLMASTEALVPNDAQRELIYRLFKFDPAKKQMAIEAKNFATIEMMKKISK